MLADVPSLTAMVVAFARGFTGASLNAVRDPYAETLLPSPLGLALRGARALANNRPLVERAISLCTLDTLAHASLRTGEIDAAVEAGVARGARQLVIVGAGLDARAYRLDSLRPVRVFEVDHPATQRLKRAKAGSLALRAKSIDYVSVDFARESLAERLEQAGHVREIPTVWIWEGVTMYLAHEAMLATLDVISARSSPRSRVIVTYAEPTFSSLPAALVPAMQAVFATIGEPIIGAIDTYAMHDALEARGLVVASDTTSREWEHDHAFTEAPLVRILERVVVADRP